MKASTVMVSVAFAVVFLLASGATAYRGRDLRPVAPPASLTNFLRAHGKEGMNDVVSLVEVEEVTGGTGGEAAVDPSVLNEDERKCEQKQKNCTRDGEQWNEEETEKIMKAFDEKMNACKTSSKEKKVVDNCQKMAELNKKKDTAALAATWEQRKQNCNADCQPVCKNKCWLGMFCPKKRKGIDCDGNKIKPAATGEEEPDTNEQPAPAESGAEASGPEDASGADDSSGSSGPEDASGPK
jgi:hypothetical protein